MATTIMCDRCGFETEDRKRIGAIHLTEMQFGKAVKEFDLCPNCVEVIREIIKRDCDSFHPQTAGIHSER